MYGDTIEILSCLDFGSDWTKIEQFMSIFIPGSNQKA